MLFLDPLTAGTLLTLASAKPQPQSCTLPKPAQIKIIPETDGLEYDYRRSLTDIQSVNIGQADPYSIHGGISITQGFAEGEITLSKDTGVQLDYRFDPHARTACIWYDSIKLGIHIDPKITIAREIKSDRCMYKAVLEHEKKHITTDRVVINDYGKIIGRRLMEKLKSEGFTRGPIPEDQIRATMTDMQYVVYGIIQDEMLAMSKERQKRQQAVDTREEYDRISALCPDFQKRKSRLYDKIVKQKQKEQGQ